MASTTLGSKWSGLNPALLATLYPVDFQGYPEADAAQVIAPPTDAAIELTANWQSPFENMGAEAKLPALAGMMQSGTLQSYAESLLGKGSEGAGTASRLSQEITDFSKDFQGRSGMTKLNSTQVFNGSPPIKISITLHFRAFSDPSTEVQAPIDQLARWMLAKKLAPSGSIVEAIQSFRDGDGFLKGLMPSLAPQMVGLRFGNQATFSPMVIESMSHPLTGPRWSDGSLLNVSVQMTLATLTALDMDDWTRARAGQPTRMFNNT